MDRYELLRLLLGQAEQLDADFISGKLEREPYHAGLEELDERMSVLGIRLSRRPWETSSRF